MNKAELHYLSQPTLGCHTVSFLAQIQEEGDIEPTSLSGQYVKMTLCKRVWDERYYWGHLGKFNLPHPYILFSTWHLEWT